MARITNKKVYGILLYSDRNRWNSILNNIFADYDMAADFALDYIDARFSDFEVRTDKFGDFALYDSLGNLYAKLEILDFNFKQRI